MTELQLENPFWQYSISQYARKEVSQTCLTLQNEYGANVNLILFCLWLAQIGKRLDWPILLQDKDREIWRQKHILPIRDRRMWMKDACLDNAEQRAEYEHLKQQELLAEQKEQAMLYKVSANMPGADNEKGRNQLAMNNLSVYADKEMKNQVNAKPLFERLLQLVA